MELDELVIIEVELKYCERCGTLWLRPCGSGEQYCAECAPKMSEHALPRPRREARLPFDDRIDLEGLCELATLCGEGGNA